MSAFEPTEIPGVYVYEPVVHGDDRGFLTEWYRSDALTDALGYPFVPEQANLSKSAKGVVRGLHFADVPPGQAKVVSCPAGHIIDILVDLRRGSETFGKHMTIELDSAKPRVVYIPNGIGHGFVSLADDSMVSYLISAAYDPEHEHAVSITDPALGIDIEGLVAWAGVEKPILSEKDAAAPTFAEFEASGRVLPSQLDCEEWDTMMRDGWALANEAAGDEV